jgi:hypothetical protein
MLEMNTMDFKVTGWLERNYKWLVALLVIVISVGGIFYYISLKDKSDTFIAATLYALFLFAAGTFINYMSNKIDDKIQDRIEIYLNIQKVYNFFKSSFDDNAIDFESTKRRIISFQVFTNRTETMIEKEFVPYIKQIGLKFNDKELEKENEFLELYSKVSQFITNIIEGYIIDNGISITCRNVIIRDISNFKPELWCKEYLSDYDADGRKMINYIYAKLNDINGEYSKLETLHKQISKLYFIYYNRSKRNIKQIEKMYGNKLQYIINQRHEILDNFDYLYKLLEGLENRISLQIDEHDEKNENNVECLDKISALMDSLSNDVEEIKNTISGYYDL